MALLGLYHLIISCGCLVIYLLHTVEGARIVCSAIQQKSHVEEVVGAAEGLQHYGLELYLILSSN